MSKDKKKTIIDYYLDHDKQYQQIYGPNCIVLLESGHFMEIYDYVEDSRHLNICRDILGIMITRRDKSDENSPFMAGIPTHSIRRYYKILLKNNYTVVIITQVTPPPDVKREVTKILSPGCNLSEDLYNNSDHGQAVLVSLVVEIDDDQEYFINLATFDSNIGETKLSYIYNEDQESNNDNLFNILREYLDKLYFNEILVNIITNKTINDNNSTELKQKFINNLGLKLKLHHFRFFEKKEITDYYQLSYQNQFLEKIFPQYKTLYCQIKENLNLAQEDPLLVINLIFLFNFISMHDKCLIQNLNKPIIDGQHQNYLKSFNETYSKLNIFDSPYQHNHSLFYYINFTSTNPGKRLLVSRLKNPLLDPQELNKQYDMIEEMLQDHHQIKIIEQNLKIIDLERIYRRFSIGKLNPYEVPKLGYSNRQIDQLISLIQKSSMTQIKTLLPTTDIINLFREYSQKIDQIFDYDKCQKCNLQNINDSLFLSGYNIEIDQLIDQRQQFLNTLENLGNELSKMVENNNKTNHLSLKYNDKEGYWLDITKVRGTKLKDQITKNSQKQLIIDNLTFELKALEYNTQNKTNTKITSHQIKTLSKNIVKLNEQIIDLTKKIYVETIERLYSQYFNHCLIYINQLVCLIDVVKSSAKAAYLYKYCRPSVSKKENSSIDLKDLRHPIIERLLIEQGGKYVSNDINLGPNNSNLLYGVNSVGKSSLLKSIAIAIIMAQSGLFVAASQCNLDLYQKIFSRTGNDDNLFLNHSSFVKEMTEAREIIQKADQYSLVIADELCASTEVESAIKIVSSIIKILSERKSSFIFATHIFRLVETKIVKSLPNLTYQHLKVEFKEELIFDRKLTPGLPENKYYGLLVATKIIQNQDFGDIISQNQNFLNDTPEILPVNKSNYNSKLYLDKCQICHYQPISENNIPLETHHINMQCNAIGNYHGIHHKNELHNLVILCRKCHQAVHKNEIDIQGHKITEKRIQLNCQVNNKINNKVDSNKLESDDLEHKKNVSKNRKKYSPTTVNLVIDFYNRNRIKTKTEILDYLRTDHNIILSNCTFNKIINNSYY